MNEYKPAKEDYVSVIFWDRYTFKDAPISIASKSHYYVEGAEKTICGTVLPDRSKGDVQGTHGYADCKTCQKIKDKLDLNIDR